MIMKMMILCLQHLIFAESKALLFLCSSFQLPEPEDQVCGYLCVTGINWATTAGAYTTSSMKPSLITGRLCAYPALQSLLGIVIAWGAHLFPSLLP